MKFQLMVTNSRNDFYTRSPASPRIHTDYFFLHISIRVYILGNVTAEGF